MLKDLEFSLPVAIDRLPLDDQGPWAARGLLHEEDSLSHIGPFRAEGRKFAIVTLVSIDRGSPRPVGAQMVVADDGRYGGYLSGGCLELAIVREAQDVIAKGVNRLVRYGKGSPYFDVRLPCGSGLDIYFDCQNSPQIIDEVLTLRASRRPFTWEKDLATGASTIKAHSGDAAWSARDGSKFIKTHLPLPRIVLLGSGPSVSAIHKLATATGIETHVWAGDEETRRTLDLQNIAHQTTPQPSAALFSLCDAFTAAVIAFHEHDAEPRILAALLDTPCFYIGALGSRTVHRRRLAALDGAGISPEQMKRIRAPIGTIPGAKGIGTLAIGILAEVMTEAKARGLVP